MVGTRGYVASKVDHSGAAFNPFQGQVQKALLVTGGTGFIGQALVACLIEAGNTVTVLSRDPARATGLFDGRVSAVGSLQQLSPVQHFDAVINLAGAPIVGPRWTATRMSKLFASRIDITRDLVAWVERAQTKPVVWIQASAIGYYGIRDPDEALTETSSPGRGFMADLCVQWENAAHAAAHAVARQVILRLGLVFGPGGALPPLLLPYRFGLGAVLGDGKQIMSWIHRDDVLALIARVLDNPTMHVIYNAVAPDAVAQAVFGRAAAQILKRPLWLKIPAAPIRWLAGEMAELFVDGQRVMPRRLIDEGFAFRFSTLQAALLDLA